jgi:hypothetical protein
VIRHALPIATLPVPMIEAPFLALLMPLTRSATTVVTSLQRADFPAVDARVVASRADVEDTTALATANFSKAFVHARQREDRRAVDVFSTGSSRPAMTVYAAPFTLRLSRRPGPRTPAFIFSTAALVVQHNAGHQRAPVPGLERSRPDPSEKLGSRMPFTVVELLGLMPGYGVLLARLC